MSAAAQGVQASATEQRAGPLASVPRRHRLAPPPATREPSCTSPAAGCASRWASSRSRQRLRSPRDPVPRRCSARRRQRRQPRLLNLLSASSSEPRRLPAVVCCARACCYSAVITPDAWLVGSTVRLGRLLGWQVRLAFAHAASPTCPCAACSTLPPPLQVSGAAAGAGGPGPHQEAGFYWR